MAEEYYIQLVRNAVKEEVRDNIRSLMAMAKIRDIELSWVIEEYRNEFSRQTRSIR